ncbi:MAG: hypothetical protein HYS22_01805 [Deltaproteobacteria bacterium]|nr:hypothetical protein [Deltaproteobacteria bacterium]
MPLNKDFTELLHFLNAVHAKYLVVGAYAVIAYTEPRYTKDLDIWIEPERTNAEKVYQALKKFGAPLKNLSIEDLVNPHMVYQIGIEPNRIDILMGIGRIPFKTAWKKRKIGHYGKEKIYLLDRDHLLRAKKEAGRLQDKRDIELLRQIKQKN